MKERYVHGERLDDLGEELFHGTQPALLSLVRNGMNERFAGQFAGTAFGNGIYLAEDVGKCDQYTRCDNAYDKNSPLHKRLYSSQADHRGKCTTSWPAVRFSGMACARSSLARAPSRWTIPTSGAWAVVWRAQ